MSAHEVWNGVVIGVLTTATVAAITSISESVKEGWLVSALSGVTHAEFKEFQEQYKKGVTTDEFERFKREIGVSDKLLPDRFVAAFRLSRCPDGWTALAQARGRYIVGLPENGELEGTRGSALRDLEDRSVGKHSHVMTGAGEHRHTLAKVDGVGSDRGAVSADTIRGDKSTSTSGLHEHRIGTTGWIDGTNAPYIQLLICEKG